MEGGGYESNCCRLRNEWEATSRRSRTWDGEHTILFIFKTFRRDGNREVVTRGTEGQEKLSSGWKRLKCIYRMRERAISI